MLAAGRAEVAFGHQTNLSTSKVLLEDRWAHYALSVSAHDLAVAIGIETDLVTPVPRAAFEMRAGDVVEYVGHRIIVEGDGKRCPLEVSELGLQRLPETVEIKLAFSCGHRPSTLHIHYHVFFDIDPKHRAIGSISDGANQEEFIFEPGLNDLAYTPASPSERNVWEQWARFFLLGLDHIAGGYDHLLFLLVLIIGSTGIAKVVAIVTAFTLAHTVTLTLAWLDLVALPDKLVEVAIALSVAYIAAENLSGRRATQRWIVAFAFGLLHGFGFAGALREITLPGDAMLITLAAFNLGVEFGQLFVVAAVFPLQRMASRKPWFGKAAQTLSAGVLLIALFWVVQRSLSP